MMTGLGIIWGLLIVLLVMDLVSRGCETARALRHRAAIEALESMRSPTRAYFDSCNDEWKALQSGSLARTRVRAGRNR